jgi:hypothetical protein
LFIQIAYYPGGDLVVSKAVMICMKLITVAIPVLLFPIKKAVKTIKGKQV